jgi:hypothetical protein
MFTLVLLGAFAIFTIPGQLASAEDLVSATDEIHLGDGDVSGKWRGGWSSDIGPWGGPFILSLENTNGVVSGTVLFGNSSCPSTKPIQLKSLDEDKLVLSAELGHPCGTLTMTIRWISGEFESLNGGYVAGFPDEGRLKKLSRITSE